VYLLLDQSRNVIVKRQGGTHRNIIMPIIGGIKMRQGTA
jgi:hypothetical protein